MCELENGVELGFWWFDDGISKLNLQTVKGTHKWCVWSGGMRRNSKL